MNMPDPMNKPLLSDERIVTNAHGDWVDIVSSDETIDQNWTDGYKVGHRKGQRIARDLYEAEFQKLRALVQTCVDDIHALRMEFGKLHNYTTQKGIKSLSQAREQGFQPSNTNEG